MDVSTLTISKPFPSFKWRWMDVNVVESFNRSDIILGITRAMYDCRGKKPSNPDFASKLKKIQNDLLSGTKVNLIPRDPARHVIRRQGRYWKGLGLLDVVGRAHINLTNRGKNLASGLLSNDDFAVEVITTHCLPNRLIEKAEVINEWKINSIELYPLMLILNVLSALYIENNSEGYLTPKEVSEVIIPMSIIYSSLNISDFADGIIQYRNDPTVVSHFPNCTPEDNDRRMVREHLLFLLNYQFLDVKMSNPSVRVLNELQRFYINDAGLEVSSQGHASSITGGPTSGTSSPRRTSVPSIVNLGAVRTKRIAQITIRPNQGRFRKIVLGNFKSQCAVTGETSEEVLDACHIQPVKNGGQDSIENGLCLRTDIHKLFDIGKLRISENGDISLSPDIRSAPSYSSMHTNITLPHNIDPDLLRRRNAYGESFI
ncbi:HNH endonuclease [Rhodobacteraceae bacterium]|nr:HNH endonuclease [Paracoccaceae bacterium]